MAPTGPGPIGHLESAPIEPLDEGVAGGSRPESDPMSRILEAALDLAWFEAAGKPLDDEELEVLNYFDALAHVRSRIDSPSGPETRGTDSKPVPGGQRPLAQPPADS